MPTPGWGWGGGQERRAGFGGKGRAEGTKLQEKGKLGTAFPVHLVLAENSKEYEISKFEPDLPGGWLWRRYIC